MDDMTDWIKPSSDGENNFGRIFDKVFVQMVQMVGIG